ncbi:MAG TPA: dihydroneopterin triphosphate diphosphatase [Gammaproteobacteria bacterium]|nr:dihydroneopterin triphosphate diphosphatase [Gammaproteobacteria bacterium]
MAADRNGRPAAAGRPAAVDSDPALGDRAAAPFRRPESVLVVIHTPALECLLLERVHPPGFWQSVTGSLEWGESAAAAARREVLEETGIEPHGLRDGGVAQRFEIWPAWQRKYAPGVTHNLEHLWYLELPETMPVQLNAAEHRAYRWCGLEEAVRAVASRTNKEALERLRSDR